MAWYPVNKELILIGSNQPINIDFQNIEKRLENPVIQKIMSDIDFGTPHSFLGSIWYLKNALIQLSSGESIISDNHPSLEFFLDLGIKRGDLSQDTVQRVGISEDGINRIIESRSAFINVFEKIIQSSFFISKAKKANFKKHWDNRVNRAYARKSFILALMSVDPNESIAHYRQAINYDASHIRAHNNLAAALIKKGNTSEAISYYKKAIKLKPDYAKAHNNLGVAFFNQGNTSAAISYYKKAIKLKPDYANAHNNLGVAFFNKGNTSEAISYYKKAIKLKPDFALAHENLKIALSKLENN